MGIHLVAADLPGRSAQPEPSVRPLRARPVQLPVHAARHAHQRAPHAKRGARCILENEYLQVSVLPDLGGHLYSCIDKVSGREMFYANPSIKKALIGYRGAWAAFGIEFNFPVSHNWMSMSPVDFATSTDADGSASIWVGNTDRGLRHAVARASSVCGRAERCSTRRSRSYNRSDVRHRFYWWTNAAVEVGDDSRLIYPDALHGHPRLHARGYLAGRRRGPRPQRHPQPDAPARCRCSPTAAASRSWASITRARRRRGALRLPGDLPTNKVWSWGVDATAWPGATRSPTTTAPTSSCRPGCSATRRPTRSSRRRTRFASRNTGCRCGHRSVHPGDDGRGRAGWPHDRTGARRRPDRYA